MNLRVDLILEEEQRSASVLNTKSLLRILTIIVPIVLGLLLAAQVMDLIRLKSELSGLEAQWQTAEPREQRALQLAQESLANAQVLNEINGWRNSRVDWHAQLLPLMRSMPDNIQLQDLRISQSFQVIEDLTPARVFALAFKGKAYGARAEHSVQRLERMLSGEAPFSNYVHTVAVPLYGADETPGADRNDRIFEIHASYREQKFE